MAIGTNKYLCKKEYFPDCRSLKISCLPYCIAVDSTGSCIIKGHNIAYKNESQQTLLFFNERYINFILFLSWFRKYISISIDTFRFNVLFLLIFSSS